MIFQSWLKSNRIISSGNVVEICSILATSKRTEEIKAIVAECLVGKDKEYSKAVYFGCITTCHVNSLSTTADYLYEQGVKGRVLEWVVKEWDEGRIVFDLHGFNLGMGCSGVRVGEKGFIENRRMLDLCLRVVVCVCVCVF